MSKIEQHEADAMADKVAFERFDRFMREAPASLPLDLDGDCYCGGRGDEHKQGCPLEQLK